jgi:hypothetical protein
MDRAWDWSDLTAELDEWAGNGRVATLWWRDDDAIAVTPALYRPLTLSRQHQVPIHLSVIPAAMSADFGQELAHDAPIVVLQHGFAHAEGELDGDRPSEPVLAELTRGRKILSHAVGDRFIPVLVPPWNLIRAEFVPVALQAGLPAISADGQRPARFVAGVEFVNTHSGPLAWENGIARFAGKSEAIGRILKHLNARRAGSADPDEATGFCTHHLINTEETWSFMEELLVQTVGHRAARWIDLREVLQVSV